jgi:hypothetical protein
MWVHSVASSFPVGPGEQPFDVRVDRDPRTPPWDLSMLQLDLAIAPRGRDTPCQALRLEYAGRTARVPIRIPEDGRMRRITLGTTIPLALDREGVLRLAFECASPATAEIGTMAVIAPRRELFYRDRYLERRKPS